MNNNPRVFVVNDAFKYNFDKAEKFGNIIPLTRGNLNVFNPDRLIWDFREKLTSFTKSDYILLSGHAIACMFAINEALRVVEEVEVLIYGAQRNDYQSVTLKRKYWEFLQEGTNGSGGMDS
jgi:hypothetical protein